MKTLGKLRWRWVRTFRAPKLADRLLLYAPSGFRVGPLVWHSHRGNEVPHLHIESAHYPEVGENRGNDHQHGSEGNLHGHPYRLNHRRHGGHWHLAIPAELLTARIELLVLLFSVTCITIFGPLGGGRICRAASNARAPPVRNLPVSMFFVFNCD